VTSAAGLLEPVLDEPVTKIFMTGEPHELAHIQMTLHEKLRARVSFATSHLKLLQVVAEGVDKAVGLARVAGMYDVPAQSVMAIGDAPNDLGMFKWAGLAVAVKNAWRDVLKAAHFAVPSNDEDGVGEAIRRFALN
jgi:hydroxymethylpyrimidine pyrophosphatase-like HAD family hydrolase